MIRRKDVECLQLAFSQCIIIIIIMGIVNYSMRKPKKKDSNIYFIYS